MAGNPDPGPSRALAGAAVLAAGVGLCWFFPLFRIVPLNSPPGGPAAALGGSSTFDPAATAERIWQKDLPGAAARSVALEPLLEALRANPTRARSSLGRGSGLGPVYYFAHGHGRVIARDRNYLKVEIPGAAPGVVALRIGPVFGNTVRDGCGLLEVNAFPGLSEFNALAAALNGLVEKQVLPLLRDQAAIGATVHFAGCAEAPETLGGPDEPLLVLVPVQAEVNAIR